MRILGLIATGLFLAVCLILDGSSGNDGSQEKIPSTYNHSSWAKAILSEFKENHESADTVSNLSKWLHRPIGLVRYPDVLPFDFLTNGD